MLRGLYFSLLLLVISCTATTTETPEVGQPTDTEIIPRLYAQNFEVAKEGKYTILTVKTAWKGATSPFKYVLYPKAEEAPTGYKDAIKVGIPVEKVLCTSTVDIAILDMLEATNRIVALSNGNYVYNRTVQAALVNKQIAAIGGSNAIDYERAVTSGAEVAMVYSLGDQKSFKKFKELGIKPILMADFMETTPLGRAEWSLFVAYFLGKEAEALTKFKAEVEAYEALTQQKHMTSPTVLTGAVYQGVWYVAGGQSLMATFIKDAGGDYLWRENKEVSGVPLDFEAVYSKGLTADYWINMSHWTSRKDLLASEKRYQDFKAFKEGKVYNYYKRTTAQGGSDVFESAIVQPHLVLQDMINLFHQEPVDTAALYYYIPLQ